MLSISFGLNVLNLARHSLPQQTKAIKSCSTLRNATATAGISAVILEVCGLAPYYVNPVYGVATICHQVRWLRWGHPSLFHTATSLLIWYIMFCVRDIPYRLIWMAFINMFSVYVQSGMHSLFNWWITVVLTYNPSVLMCVEVTDAPKL